MSREITMDGDDDNDEVLVIRPDFNT